MAYEIETKAHVEQDILEKVKSSLQRLSADGKLEYEDKIDIYWSLEQENQDRIFRTRLEMTEKGNSVLFTSKPTKTRASGGLSELNKENEFLAPGDQWDDIMVFLEELGCSVCRRKRKTGYHCMIEQDGFHVHAELLEVVHLGWFLEMEICPENLEDFDQKGAREALFELLKKCDIPLSAIESRGYNRMLTEVGKNLG